MEHQPSSRELQNAPTVQERESNLVETLPCTSISQGDNDDAESIYLQPLSKIFGRPMNSMPLEELDRVKFKLGDSSSGSEEELKSFARKVQTSQTLQSVPKTSCPYKKHCFSLQQAVISFDCY